MTIQTPNNIEVLLHYHTFVDPHPRRHAPAVAEATQMLVENGCIEEFPKESGRFVTTAKGAALVRLLCNVSIPKEALVDDAGNVIWTA